MRSQFDGRFVADEKGPLASGPEGEEDFRSLLLAVAGLMWPRDGEGSWLASFGESGPESIASGRSRFTVESSVPANEGGPLAALTVTVGLALSIAGNIDLDRIEVETRLSDRNLDWDRWSWAKNLGRHTDDWFSGAYCIVDASKNGSGESSSFAQDLADALYYSGREYNVTPVEGAPGIYHVHAIRWGFLHAGLLLDAASSALARAGHRGATRIVVQRSAV